MNDFWSGKHHYFFADEFDTKSKAKKWAAFYRKDGSLARVIKYGRYWRVYSAIRREIVYSK